MANSQKIEELRGGLIVSCQAPSGSPLDEPQVIAAMAEAAAGAGASGIRVNGARKIETCRNRIRLPIIGIEKLVTEGSEVYITPGFESASRLSQADIIAIDATQRKRPGGEQLGELIKRIRGELGLPVMADIATYDEALKAAELGADIVATTLCGYTSETRGERLPALELVSKLAAKVEIPVICEGGVGSPEELRMALESGAFAVVVGTAITGITELTARFAAASGVRKNA